MTSWTSFILCRQCSRTAQAVVNPHLHPPNGEGAVDAMYALNKEFRKLGWRVSESDMGKHLCPRCKESATKEPTP